MPFDIPKSESKIAPSGTHIARLVSVVDMGTQPSKNYSPSRKIRFSWELPNETEVFDKDKGEQPYMVHREYTLSLSEKSHLRIHLESWRGKPFSPAELLSFDESKIVGKPCMVTVLHNEKGERVYSNVTAVSNIPKGTEVPDQINTSIVYNTKEGNSASYKALPEWLQAKIAESPEFKKSTGEGSLEEAISTDSDDDEIPF